jgi:hypothetical protein
MSHTREKERKIIQFYADNVATSQKKDISALFILPRTKIMFIARELITYFAT